MSLPKAREAKNERGDTLIEVLFTVVIIAIAFSGLLGALVTAITGSTEHRGLAVDDTLLKSVAESAKNQIEQTSSSAGSTFATCASSYTIKYTPPTNATQYTINGQSYSQITSTTPATVTLNSIKYWSTTANDFTATCNPTQPPIQLVTISALGPDKETQQLSFVLRKPNP